MSTESSVTETVVRNHLQAFLEQKGFEETVRDVGNYRNEDELKRDLALATVRCSCEYLAELEAFDEKWGPRFPVITQAWLNAWEHVTPFLAFPPEVRRAIADVRKRGVTVIIVTGQLLDALKWKLTRKSGTPATWTSSPSSYGGTAFTP